MDAQTIIDAINGAIMHRNKGNQFEKIINQLTMENSALYFKYIMQAATAQNNPEFVQVATLMAKNFLSSKISTVQVLRGVPWKSLQQEERQQFINALNINMLNGYQYVNQLLAILILQSEADEARIILGFIIQQIIKEDQTVAYIQEAIRIFKLVFLQNIGLYFPDVSQMIQQLLENTAKLQSKIILVDCIEILELYSRACTEDISDNLFNMLFQMLQQCVQSGNQKVIEHIYQIFINGINSIDIVHRMIDGIYAIQHLLNYCIYSVEKLNQFNNQVYVNGSVNYQLFNKQINEHQDLIPLLIQQMNFVKAVVESSKTQSIYNTDYIYSIIQQFIKPIIMYHSAYNIFDITEMAVKTLTKIYKNGNKVFQNQYKEFVKTENLPISIHLQMSHCYAKEINIDVQLNVIEQNLFLDDQCAQISICKLIKKMRDNINIQKVNNIIAKQLQYYTQKNDQNDESYIQKLPIFSRELCKLYLNGKLFKGFVEDIFNCFFTSKKDYFTNLSFTMVVRQSVCDELLSLISKGNNNMGDIFQYLKLTLEVFYPQLIQFNDQTPIQQLTETQLIYQEILYNIFEANFFGFGDQIADTQNNDYYAQLYNLTQIPNFKDLIQVMQTNLQYLIRQNSFQYDNIVTAILQALPIVSQADPRQISQQTIEACIYYIQTLYQQSIFNETFNSTIFLMGHVIEYLQPQQQNQMMDIVQGCLYQSVNSLPQIAAIQFLVNYLELNKIVDIAFIEQFLLGIIAHLYQFNLESEKDLTFISISAKLLITLQDTTQYYIENGEKIAYTIIQSYEYRKKETNKGFYTALYMNGFSLLLENYTKLYKREIVDFINKNSTIFQNIIKWVETSGFRFQEIEHFKKQFGTILMQNQNFRNQIKI